MHIQEKLSVCTWETIHVVGLCILVGLLVLIIKKLHVFPLNPIFNMKALQKEASGRDN